jgi:hypothetical protein
MPPPSLQKNAAIDQRIPEIIDSVLDRLKVNLSKLALEHGVPYYRLLARLKRRGTLQSRPLGTSSSLMLNHALYA